MKKLMIIFIGVGMTLVSCKTRVDGMASNANDDVYYNPSKDRKANVAPQPTQYGNQNQQQAYDPNAGKIAATDKDKNNPYYKDPAFNYDDYYDNAYAARINRFQKPIYGAGYYDPYYTNQYSYTGNPSQYGSSIYNSYNMGSSYGYGGYYSPSQAFNNAYYNPFYNGYGSSMGYGMGYGSGLSIGYGMGYGSGMGMGYGGYNPYCGMGYGYNPYGMGGYGMGYGGYNPYGMGYGYSSPMYSSGYYNSYDYNSSTYHYGPRGSHSGGNSTTNSPLPQPHHMVVNNPNVSNGAGQFSEERFSQVSIPKENYIKMVEAKNPPAMYQNNGMMNNNGQGGESAPIRNNPYYHTGGSNNGGMFSNGTFEGGAVRPNQQNGGNYSPNAVGGGSPQSTPNAEPRHKWFSGVTFGGGDNGNTPSSSPTPSIRGGNGGSFGGGNSGGSSAGTPSNGANISRPRK